MTDAPQPLRAFLLLGLVALPFWVNLGEPPLWDVNEPYYAETAREMVELGDWLFLHYNYEPRFQKPPLPVWTLAASYRLLGVSEVSARLPMALMTALTLFLLYRLGGELHSPRLGLVAACLTGVSLKVFTFSRQYAGDVLLMLNFVACIWLFVRWDRSDGKRTGSLRALWIVAGLSLLIKGPVSLLPLVVALASLVERRRLSLLKSPWLLAEAALWLAGLGLPWFVLQVLVHGQAYLEVAFLRESLSRIVTEDLGARPFWYYGPALVAGALPGSVLFLVGLLHAALRRQWGWLRQASLPAWWLLGALLVLSLVKGKREVYLLPIYPALGLLVGFQLEEALERGKTALLRAWAVWLALFALGVAALGGLAFHWLDAHWGLVLVTLGLVGSFGVVVAALRRRWLAAGTAAVAMTALVWLTAAWGLTQLRPWRPVPAFAALALQHEHDALATYLVALPSLMFYAEEPVEACWSREEFKLLLAATPQAAVVMPRSVYDYSVEDFSEYRWRILAERPYLRLTGSHLLALRRGQGGTPLVLVLSERKGAP